ncbi:MAG TPA: hypothetical protein VLY83_00995 [Methanoregula sp.]|nr:hypothetical protein [Methanoregula sp.]
MIGIIAACNRQGAVPDIPTEGRAVPGTTEGAAAYGVACRDGKTELFTGPAIIAV